MAEPCASSGRRSVTSSLLTLASIGLIQLLAVISPGPSFLITARTAVAQSRADGIKVALGLAPAPSSGRRGRSWPQCRVSRRAGALHRHEDRRRLFLLYIAWMIFRHAAEPLKIEGEAERLSNPFVKASSPRSPSEGRRVLRFDLHRHAAGGCSAVDGAGAHRHRQLQRSVVVFRRGAVFRFRPGAELLSEGQGVDRPCDRIFLGVLGLRLLWAAREGL